MPTAKTIKIPDAIALRTTVDGEPAIFVSGRIFTGFGMMLAEYVQSLHNEYGKPVNLYLDSPGGYLSEAFSFYDFIRAKGIALKVEGFGVVGSAATVMAMAAGRDNLTLAENTDWFIHRVQFVDEYGQVIEGDDAERERLNAKLVAAYMAHTGLDEAAVNALLDEGDANNSISAAKAVELGFAAGIVPVASSKAAALRTRISLNDHTPTSIPTMSTKKVAIKLSLKQAINSLTAEGATVEVDLDEQAAKTIADLTAERDAKVAEVGTLNAKITDLEAAAATAKTEATQATEAKATAETAVAAKTTEVTNLTARIAELEESLDLPAAKRTVPRAEASAIGRLPGGNAPTAADLAAKAFAAENFNGLDVKTAEANRPK